MLPAASAALILSLAIRPAVPTRLAYQLRAVGYSPVEVSDIVSGRVSRRTIDTAHSMRLVGRSREAAALLAAEYRRGAPAALPTLSLLAPEPEPTPVLVVAPVVQHIAATTRPIPAPKPQPTARVSTPQAARPAMAAAPLSTTRLPTAELIDAAITKYSRLHAVDASLIRAIVAAESGFGPAARSSAGAIGLMQLMPATARTLGVNPKVPDENIEGGVRYMSQLLKMFGQVELALVAYNAGPAFAERYARGEAALYAETREYVTQVLGRISRPR